MPAKRGRNAWTKAPRKERDILRYFAPAHAEAAAARQPGDGAAEAPAPALAPAPRPSAQPAAYPRHDIRGLFAAAQAKSAAKRCADEAPEQPVAPPAPGPSAQFAARLTPGDWGYAAAARAESEAFFAPLRARVEASQRADEAAEQPAAAPQPCAPPALGSKRPRLVSFAGLPASLLLDWRSATVCRV